MNTIETQMKHHTCAQVWGGNENGVTLQVTTSNGNYMRDPGGPEQQPGAIRLTLTEAAALIPVLQSFVTAEATRRQGLLHDKMDEIRLQIKGRMRTVFDEIESLDAAALKNCVEAIQIIDTACPKTRKQGGETTP